MWKAKLLYSSFTHRSLYVVSKKRDDQIELITSVQRIMAQMVSEMYHTTRSKNMYTFRAFQYYCLKERDG